MRRSINHRLPSPCCAPLVRHPFPALQAHIQSGLFISKQSRRDQTHVKSNERAPRAGGVGGIHAPRLFYLFPEEDLVSADTRRCDSDRDPVTHLPRNERNGLDSVHDLKARPTAGVEERDTMLTQSDKEDKTYRAGQRTGIIRGKGSRSLMGER